MKLEQSNAWHTPGEIPKASTNQVHVWKVELNQPPGVVLALRQSLAPDELARAKRFRWNRDRRRFIVGRAALRDIVSRYLSAEPSRIRLIYGDRGKPRLDSGQPSSDTDSELWGST